MLHRQRLHALAVLGLGAVLLSGCTAPAPAPTPDADVSAAPTGVPGLPDGVVPATDLPVDVPNDPAARADVQLAGCEATADGWMASGAATNSGADPVDYTITVFFATETATVIDSASTTLTVAPGDTADWQASADFTAPAGTTCVLRGVSAGA